MPRRTIALLVLSLVASIGFGAAQGANAVCANDTDGAHTFAGSCKDNLGSIKCGTTGEVSSTNGIHQYVNTVGGVTEIEACKAVADGGAPNEHGRFVVRINSAGTVVIADSDYSQWQANAAVSAGYLLVEGRPQHTPGPGLYCHSNSTATNPAAADGYAKREGPHAESGLQCPPVIG